MEDSKILVPPIKCQGIKTKIVPLIKEKVKRDENGIWIEPFVGTGVVAFNMAPQNALLCDRNKYIISLYTGIQNETITSKIVREFLEHHGAILEHQEEFNELLYNDDVQILMASIGGNNTNSILPYIDYGYLKGHPKIVIGYSDVTALLLAIYAKTGLVTFYGPAVAASFGELPPYVDWTYDYFMELMTNSAAIPHTFRLPEIWTDEFINWSEQDRSKAGRSNQWTCVNPGVCRGRLIGGNLNTMEGFLGTEYMPEIIEGDILLLEDSLKDASTIERSFSLLKLAGVFDKVSGIILGKHERFDDNGTGRKPYEILLEVLGSKDIPVLADFDCCHTHPMLTLPIGCEVELNVTGKAVTLLEHPLQ